MKKLFLATLLALFVFGNDLTEIDLPKGAKKKVMKSLDGLWPETTIDASLISLEGLDRDQIDKELKRSQLYLLSSGNQSKGYLFLTAAPSRYNDFDLMVIYDSDLSILDTKILIYREDWGGEIASKRWLKQFFNKSSQDELVLGRDIQGISGATISVRSATHAIRSITKIMTELKTKGLLK